MYPIPCPITAIEMVLVGGTEYLLRDVNESEAGQFYYYMDGSIGIYPSPEQDIQDGLMVFHYKVPRRLGLNDMNAEPDLDPDYRMLLVWGVAKDVTENAQDKASFRGEYSSLLLDYSRSTAVSLPDIRVE